MDTLKNTPSSISSPPVADLNAPTVSGAVNAPDPFDPSRLRLSQHFSAAIGVKKLLTTVPIRKPSKEWFVRCHPDPAYRIDTCVVELKEDAEIYLVDPKLWHELADETTFSPRMFITTINRQGNIFLWPIRLASADGRHDDWSKSALEAATYAIKSWVRVQANVGLGAYEVHMATGNLGDPEWTVPTFSELLRIAFKDHFIDSFESPVLKRLRGEA